MEQLKKYPTVSWVDPRLEILPSPIGGLGVFTKQLIREREREGNNLGWTSID